MLKTAVLPNIFMETKMFIYLILFIYSSEFLMNRKFKS